MKLHVELTSRCVLECPGCPRTQFKELVNRPIPKGDLDIDDFERFLDCKSGNDVTIIKLCGDFGDAIYYPKLFEFITRFRPGRSFTIMTNGSHRDQKFWNHLASLLTKDDTIIFAIDGLQDTNHIYRKNANWDSIMLGLDIMVNSSPANVHWKTIAFSYNVAQLEQIKQFAMNKGATFRAEKTHRFGDDSLIPKSDLVETDFVYHERFSSDHSIKVNPQCLEANVVGFDGYFYPCGWLRNPRAFYKSQLWKNREYWLKRLDIKNCNLDQGLEIVTEWANFVRQNSIEQNGKVDVLCRMKCREGCKSTNNIEL